MIENDKEKNKEKEKENKKSLKERESCREALMHLACEWKHKWRHFGFSKLVQSPAKQLYKWSVQWLMATRIAHMNPAQILDLQNYKIIINKLLLCWSTKFKVVCYTEIGNWNLNLNSQSYLMQNCKSSKVYLNPEFEILISTPTYLILL